MTVVELWADSTQNVLQPKPAVTSRKQNQNPETHSNKLTSKMN